MFTAAVGVVTAPKLVREHARAGGEASTKGCAPGSLGDEGDDD